MVPMLTVIVCLGVVLATLALAEELWKRKILRGEKQRKFVHILIGTFIAFWPWLMSWRTIQIIAAFMLLGVLLNRYRKTLHFTEGLNRTTYGDIFFTLAVLLCALLTTNKVFFLIAILHMALADGLAAVAGKKAGKNWAYKAVGQTKTVIGSMAFWIVSLSILGIGTLFAHDQITFNSYAALLFVLPPALTFLENISPLGSDNITVPIATLAALNAAA